MGILDSLFGRKDDDQTTQNANNSRAHSNAAPPQNADEQALARYRYMLQTAPPEDIESAHQEAFSKLTPEQRQMILGQMSQIVPQNEAAHLSDDPRDLARAATRAEMRQPGAMNRMFGGSNAMGSAGGGMMGGNQMGGGMMGGMGGMMAGSLLTSIAGGFIGSSIANSFFNHGSNEQMFQSSPEAQSVDGGVNDFNGGEYQQTDLNGSDANIQEGGLDSSADPYGDPADAGDSSGFADAGFDGGGDFGGFDGGDFGGDF